MRPLVRVILAISAVIMAGLVAWLLIPRTGENGEITNVARVEHYQSIQEHQKNLETSNDVFELRIFSDGKMIEDWVVNPPNRDSIHGIFTEYKTNREIRVGGTYICTNITPERWQEYKLVGK